MLAPYYIKNKSNRLYNVGKEQLWPNEEKVLYITEYSASVLLKNKELEIRKMTEDEITVMEIIK